MVRPGRRILHDQTADQIVEVVSQLSHVNATIVPFLVAPGIDPQASLTPCPSCLIGAKVSSPSRKTRSHEFGPRVPDTTPISQLKWRTRTRIGGRVKSLRVQAGTQAHDLECVLVDSSGHAATLVFLGRRSISGIRSGTILIAEGMVGKHRGKLAIINPIYELVTATEPSDAP